MEYDMSQYYNKLINYMDINDFETCCATLEEMKKNKIYGNIQIYYLLIINFGFKITKFENITFLYNRMTDDIVIPDVSFYERLIFLAIDIKYEVALRFIYEKMIFYHKPTILICSKILNFCEKVNNEDLFTFIFDEMIKYKFKFSSINYKSMIETCKKLNNNICIYVCDKLIVLIRPHNEMINFIINLYIHFNEYNKIIDLYEILNNKFTFNDHHINLFLEIFIEYKQEAHALKIYKNYIKENNDSLMNLYMMKLYINMENLQNATYYYEKINKNIKEYKNSHTQLIELCCKLGDINLCKYFYEKSKKMKIIHDSYLYENILNLCCIFNDIEFCVNCYNYMIENNIHPKKHIYNNIITMTLCGHMVENMVIQYHIKEFTEEGLTYIDLRDFSKEVIIMIIEMYNLKSIINIIIDNDYEKNNLDKYSTINYIFRYLRQKNINCESVMGCIYIF